MRRMISRSRLVLVPPSCSQASSSPGRPRGRRTRAAAAPGAPGTAAPPAGGASLRVEGLPIVKPPYGVLAANDLDKGELKFQVPHGDTPDNVRTNPALQGMHIPKTGQNSSVGLMVTRTLVVLGDGRVTAPPGRPCGAMRRV